MSIIFATAFSLFLISNSLGNLPFILALLKSYPAKRQRAILIREMLIALGILFVFGFFGDNIIGFLGISEGIIGIAGGALLFIIALTMVFPSSEAKPISTQEPFIVPIAIPCMSGPGSIAAVMLYSTQFDTHWKMSLVILISWGASLLVLLTAPYIKRAIGDRGLIALERFGGLLMCLISIQLISSGLIQQVKGNFCCKEVVSEKQPPVVK